MLLIAFSSVSIGSLPLKFLAGSIYADVSAVRNFRLFLTTRNPNPELPPDCKSIINAVNFTTTRASLTGQVYRLGLCLPVASYVVIELPMCVTVGTIG